VTGEDLGVAALGGALSVGGVDDGEPEIHGELGLIKRVEGGGVEASASSVLDVGVLEVSGGEVSALDGGGLRGVGARRDEAAEQE
jgi:hypothetical protein